MNTIAALAAALAELVREDPRRVLIGEDVVHGGMLGLSRACLDDPELASRVVATPLLPTTLAAHAGGLALAGLRPIVLLPAASALIECFAALREVATLSLRGAAERSMPVLFVAPCGPGFGLGGDAFEAPEATLVRIAGLRVICVGRAPEAAAQLRAAAAFEAGEEPTVLLVPRTLLTTVLDDPPAAELDHPLGAAVRVRAGRTITVLAWGECVELALAGCDAAGVDAQVIDVGCLAPLDRERLIDAAKDTGRIAIVHAGPRAHGIGAELAALLADEAIHYLDGPIMRICGDEPTLAGADEMRALPGLERIADALEQLAAP
jgi:pyruvate/2-oxoglutarate/acetoin dehydrogenase E1 component